MLQEKVLAIALATDVPVLLWGEPGIGKTATIRSLGQSLGLHVETVIASLHEPSDFLGLPVPDLERDRTRFLPPEWFRRLEEAGTGILFLDEISTAPPAVQAACLRLVLERSLGSRTLPPGVRIVAAANPPSLAAGGFELSPPAANRFCHIDWRAPSAEAWAAGLLQGFPVPEIPIPKDWEKFLPLARSLVGGFILARPQLLLRVPEDPEQLGRAWPSPRSWEMASRMLAGALALDSQDEGLISLAVGSCVGLGPGQELAAFVIEGLLDPREALENWEGIELPTRADRLFVLVGSVSGLVTQEQDKEKRSELWIRAWKLFGRVQRETGQADVVLIGARPLFELYRSLARSGKQLPIEPVKEELARFGRFLQDILK
jgi:hypothetical protein